MPTIKEIAEECGVTKQTVTVRLRSLGLWEGHVQKDGRAFVVDQYAASAVAAAVGRGRSAGDDPMTPDMDADSMSALDGAMEANRALKMALSAAQEQIGVLTRELDAKNAQISDLGDRLAAAQESQRQAQDTIDRLAGRSWFDRLLGRGLPAPK